MNSFIVFKALVISFLFLLITYAAPPRAVTVPTIDLPTFFDVFSTFPTTFSNKLESSLIFIISFFIFLASLKFLQVNTTVLSIISIDMIESSISILLLLLSTIISSIFIVSTTLYFFLKNPYFLSLHL